MFVAKKIRFARSELVCGGVWKGEYRMDSGNCSRPPKIPLGYIGFPALLYRIPPRSRYILPKPAARNAR